MPFDGRGWKPQPPPPPPPPAPPSRRGEATFLVLITVGAILMLVLPISVDALIDLIRYLEG